MVYFFFVLGMVVVGGGGFLGFCDVIFMVIDDIGSGCVYVGERIGLNGWYFCEVVGEVMIWCGVFECWLMFDIG